MMVKKSGPTHVKPVSPCEAGVEGFILSLMEMDPRIKDYSFYEDVEEKVGYIPTKKQIMFPVDFPRGTHQISHIVEMNNFSRLTKKDWGMKTPEIHQKGWQSPGGFFAAMARKIRVRAIELHMQPKDNHPKSTMYNITNNPYWDEESRARLHFGRFKSPKDIKHWSNDLREKTSNAWSLDRIRHEWEIRLDYLRDWMESKKAA
jgi:hypothetical protein